VRRRRRVRQQQLQLPVIDPLRVPPGLRQEELQPLHRRVHPHRASIAALAGAGFPVTATDILTAPVIAAAYLKEHYPGARCLLLNIGDIGEDLAGVALPTRTTRPVSSSNGFT
jgi:hypothetical protein